MIIRRDDDGQAFLVNYDELLGNWSIRMREQKESTQNAPPIAELFMTRYEGVLQGNFGQSTRYGESVLQVIAERLPVSSYFGLLTFFITYLICIPLGVFKAVRHNQLSDDLTSILIFVGYAVPGYALGSLLLLFLSVNMDLLPMGGLVSDGYRRTRHMGQAGGFAFSHHTAFVLLFNWRFCFCYHANEKSFDG